MAPRKNSKINNTTQKSPRKGKPRIVKTNSESLNYIKIEIPVKKSSDTPRRVTRKRILNGEQKIALGNNELDDEQKTTLANEDSPRRVTKMKMLNDEQQIALANEDYPGGVTKKTILNNEQKTALANEVVRYQLNKKPRKINFQKKVPTVEVINNNGKSKPVVSKYFGTQPQNEEVDKVNENPKKKVNKKTTSDSNVVAKKAITRKRSADSTQKTEKCIKAKETNVEPKRRRITKNNKVPQKEIIEGKNDVTEKLKNENNEYESKMINVQANSTLCPVSNCAGRIDSRKTSSTSTSCMSWTKDLSTSSRTSVAATSRDFVRIDKKMPILKLTNIDSKIINEIDEKTVKDNDILSINSDSSDSTNSEKSIDGLNIKSVNLNLSTSSLSTLPIINVKSHQNNPLKDELNKAFAKLTSKLKHFDVEIMSWIGYGKQNTDVSMKDFQDKIIKALKEECEVISHCRHLKRILSKDDELKPSEVDSDEIFVKAHIEKVNVTAKNVPECKNKGKNISDHQLVHSVLAETDYNDNDHVKLKSNENYDDEDAISIYAESLTGIESEKIHNSITLASDDLEHVEYIPEPIKKTESLPKKYTYCPTKISENNQLILKKSICEKQNADSTSIFKDNYRELVSEDDINSISSEYTQDNIINNGSAKIAELPQVTLNQEPLLINDMHKPQGQISGIFKNICSYNLFNRCKHKRCRYLHVIPDVLEVKSKLQALNNEAFVSEYMAIRKVYAICRKYGSCFIEECCNRHMLRLLVDMAKHFFMNAIIKCKDDSIYIREILESILLKLNTADLNNCEDLLMQSVTPTMLLCDVFMQTIAETQNFSRFKLVFFNLTHFIVSHGGIFNLFAAEHILERVCILPPEKPLARALLDIMRNTDSAIFRNSMVGKFENILLTLDKKLHGDLLSIKMEAIGSLLTSPNDSNASSHYSNHVESLMPVNTVTNVPDKIYTSPDTTDVNTLKNKFTSDVRLTRTVNFNKSHFKEPGKTNPSNENVENRQMTENLKKWVQKSPYNNISPLLLSYPVTRPGSGSIKNKRRVAYRPTVTRYQRRPQRDF